MRWLLDIHEQEFLTRKLGEEVRTLPDIFESRALRDGEWCFCYDPISGYSFGSERTGQYESDQADLIKAIIKYYENN